MNRVKALIEGVICFTLGILTLDVFNYLIYMKTLAYLQNSPYFDWLLMVVLVGSCLLLKVFDRELPMLQKKRG